MRYRIYTYIHLVILFLYILGPVMPYIEYAVNKDYIARHLCINKDEPQNCCEGKCYLEKQIMKSIEPDDSKEKNTNEKIQYEDVKEFLIPHVSIPKVLETNLNLPVKSEIFNRTKIVTAIFVPPRLKFIL